MSKDARDGRFLVMGNPSMHGAAAMAHSVAKMQASTWQLWLAVACLMRVAFDGDAECAAEAQVGNLQALARIVHKQVLWLQIAVHHAVLVAVRDTFYQLVHEALRASCLASVGL